MADATCALPRFDPADAPQATFYAAAKVCADDAWRDVLRQAGLDGAVTVVTVTAPVSTSCGDLTPASPATQCEGTVYLGPAHLRDTEQNGRYPGRYLGVFLREYARGLQDTTGLRELVGAVTTGAAEDLDRRLAQQATCLAGVASGAMSGRGAVDANITREVRDRLTTVDAPPDAKAWLDKGFQQRTPAACNTWLS
jgi:predicted metalloprotease